MESTTIEVLGKTLVQKKAQQTGESGCCGGAPVNNQDACCKLDEDKKAANEEGCGCSGTKTASACCN